MRMSLLNIDQGKEVSEGMESPGSLVSGYCELARQKRFNINVNFFYFLGPATNQSFPGNFHVLVSTTMEPLIDPMYYIRYYYCFESRNKILKWNVIVFILDYSTVLGTQRFSYKSDF